jgi:N-acetyl-anhydromuramyl-L-alanine amidase AmpD
VNQYQPHINQPSPIVAPVLCSFDDDTVIALAKRDGYYEKMVRAVQGGGKAGKNRMVFQEISNDLTIGIVVLFANCDHDDNGWMLYLWDRTEHSDAEINRSIAALMTNIGERHPRNLSSN